MTHTKKHCRCHWYFCPDCCELSKLVVQAQGQTPPKKAGCASCGGTATYDSPVNATQEE